jgi:transcriptional regulator with XRE-family HTH domain
MVERIKALCRKRNLSLNALEKELELSKSSIAKWDENVPSIDKVEKVADYFGVSVDYLRGRARTVVAANLGGSRYDELNDDEKAEIDAYIEFRLERLRKVKEGE